MASIIMGALQNRTASPDQDAAQQNATLQGADPGLLGRQADQMNKLMGVMFVQSFQRLPNVANYISQAMKAWSRVQKELQQAASVQSVMKKSPINQSLVANPMPSDSVQ